MTSSRYIASLVLVCLIVMVSSSLGADEAALVPYRALLEKSGFPENDETRRLLSDAVTAPAYPAVETPFKMNRQLADGRLVQFEVRKTVRDWYLIFRNQRGEEPRETYPLWGRGTWIIKKDLLTGSYIQAKIFLQDDEDSFVRLFPMGENRSRLDVHLYGRQIGDDVIIPVPFETLLFSPFARIVSLSDRSIPWELIFPDPGSVGYAVVADFIADLRPYADSIREIPDGAVDGGGTNVYIESGLPVLVGDDASSGGALARGETGLNCSGYVKWVADGIYSGWMGTPGARHLELPPLREPTSRSNRNPWSESRSAVGADARSALETRLRDPHFGLDWNRNLARVIEETRIGRSLSEREADKLDTGNLSGVPHYGDMGYRLEDLAPALYQLAATDPGVVYLAAINSRFMPAPSPDDPDPLPLHQYWHVSILAPWFDSGRGGSERGTFRVAVLDVGDVSETLLTEPLSDATPLFQAFIMANALRYARLGRDDTGTALVPEVMVHLSRVSVPKDFEPASLPELR